MPRLGQRNITRTFWSRIDRRGDDECWPWLGYRHAKGYGRSFVWVGDRVYVVPHRASWAIHYGPPGDMHVCHRCDNPPCCNPRHLFLGTNIDNVKDRVAKGRTQRGIQHFKARVTEDDVRAIRASTERPAAIARRYGISYGTVAAILTRRTWKHV